MFLCSLWYLYIVGLGTLVPEVFFAAKREEKREERGERREERGERRQEKREERGEEKREIL